MSNYEVASVEELEPLRFPEVKEEEVLGSKKIEISLDDEESDGDDVQKSQDDDRDEINGQMKLF